MRRCWLLLFSLSSFCFSPEIFSQILPIRKVAPAIFLPPTNRYDSLRTTFSDYAWMTDAGRAITSVFAEYRPTHFHGGIDVSTKDYTGYAVFASRDGYVSRILVGPTGYGKQLWLQHADGYSTTYAHLRNFNNAIDSLVHHEQLLLERYPIRLECKPNDLPVKKGDLIAFTGETGTGSPHLHFEIRDENKNFVNPFFATQFTISDDSLPRFFRFSASPIGENSYVNNSSQSHVVEFGTPQPGNVSLNDTLYVHGTFGFAVDVRDRINESRFNSGAYSHKLFLDDSLIYAVQFDRAPSDDAYQVGLYYDFELMSDEGGRLAKLYMDSPNRLPFIQTRPPNAGIITSQKFPLGLHKFRIVSSDFWKNTSELSGTIVFTDEPNFLQIADSLIRIAKERMTVKPKRARGKRAKQPAITAELEHQLESDFVRIWLKTNGGFTSIPSFVLQDGGGSRTLQTIPVDFNRYTATFRPHPTGSSNQTVIVECEVNGKVQALRDEFELHHVARKPTTITADNGKIEIIIDSTSFFKPLLLEIEKRSDEESNSLRYSILPRFTILDRELTVKVRANANQPKEALFFRGRGSRWQLASTKRDGDFLVTQLTQTLGDIAVLSDTKPPTVTRLLLPTRLKKQPHVVSFSVDDNLSGVEYKDLKLYIDGVFVVPEIDGEHRRVVNTLPAPLTKGIHSIRILLSDRLGNSSDIRRTFRVR